MIQEEDILKLFIRTIEQEIESLERNDHNEAIFELLTLLLSDNVSSDGKILTRYSLLNKKFHLSFSNHKDYMSKYIEKHLQN